MSTFFARACALGVTLSAIGMAPAIAQDKTVELRFAHWLPGQHALAKLGFEPWAKSLEAATKGSIKVMFFPAQQLGKAADHYDMARDGIADMTWVSPGYQTGRFPIFEVSELPFQIGSTGGGSAAIHSWYQKYAATEMKDIKVCLLHNHIGALHSKRPISEPSQIKGLKMRSSNGMVAQMTTQLGGTNVQVSAVEARDALDKGVADGLTYPWRSLVTFNIHKAVKYHLDAKFYSGNFVWAINKSWYNRLSPAQKKAVDDHCNEDWAQKIGVAYGDFEDSGLAMVEKEPGHTVIKPTPAQLAAWKKAVEPITVEWAKSVEKAGGKPQEVLDHLRSELAARNAAY